jgi:flap endonuclease-1
MGITNLKKLIKDTSVRRRLADYRGKVLAVDASIFLYQYVYRDEPNAVLFGLLRQLLTFHRNGITPLYVFDGKALEVKIVIEERQLRREQVQTEMVALTAELSRTLDTLGEPIVVQSEAAPVAAPFSELDVAMFIESDEEEVPEPVALEPDEADSESLKRHAVHLSSRIASLEKQTRRPTRAMVQDCKDLLELLGVPYIQSPSESDLTLSELTLSRQVDGIISEDTDMLPFGCETFITGFRYDRDFVEEYSLARALEHLSLTREQFVDMCILCGCDYAEKIYKVGVKTAYEMICMHKNIEGTLRHISSRPRLAARHTYPDDFEAQVHRARSMFLLRHPGDDPELGELPLPEHKGPRVAWNFEVAHATLEEFGEWLAERDLLETPFDFFRLCEPWPEVRNTQSTLDSFFTKKERKADAFLE